MLMPRRNTVTTPSACAPCVERATGLSIWWLTVAEDTASWWMQHLATLRKMSLIRMLRCGGCAAPAAVLAAARALQPLQPGV